MTVDGVRGAAGTGDETALEIVDEFGPFLAEQMRNPVFRHYYERIVRKHAQNHWWPVPVKPSQHRRGWRR